MNKDSFGLRVARPLSRLVTSSHDEYLSAFRHLRLRGFLLAPADRPWSMTRCRLSFGSLERGADAAPWSASGTTAEGAVTVAFSGSPDAQLLVDGQETSQDLLCVWPGGARLSIVARGRADWFVLTVEGQAGTGLVRPGGKVTPGDRGGSSVLCPVRPEELAGLRALAARLLGSAEAAGPAGLSPEAAEVLGQPLLAEVTRLANVPNPPFHRQGSPRIGRRAVLERVEEALDARPSEPVYIADLCAATGLAERTLRHIFIEQYGAGPIRVLKNRRLCQLRRCLPAEGDGGESLARIAARHGFRHMGMLAGDYRELFGELPSETRRRGGGIEPASGPEVRGVVPHAVLDGAGEHELAMTGAGPGL